MRILIVNGEKRFRTNLQRALKANGYAVDCTADVAGAFAYITSVHYDLAIIDATFADGTAIHLLKQIRAMGFTMPVLVTAADNEVGAKVEAFQAGADDHVVRPVTTAELSVRVQALLRRSPYMQENVVKVVDLEINRLTRQVKRAGKRIELSVKEYSLLEYMSLNTGRAISRVAIMERIWDHPFDITTNVVDVYIAHLRRKVDGGHAVKLIHTIRGIGYALDNRQAAASL